MPLRKYSMCFIFLEPFDCPMYNCIWFFHHTLLQFVPFDLRLGERQEQSIYRILFLYIGRNFEMIFQTKEKVNRCFCKLDIDTRDFQMIRISGFTKVHTFDENML